MTEWAFQADSRIPLDPSLLEVDDVNILRVKGFTVDSITDASPVMSVFETWEGLCAKDSLNYVLEPIQAAANRTKLRTDESIRAIACTLIASHYGMNFHKTRQNEDECVELYQSYLQYINASDRRPRIYAVSTPSGEAEIKTHEYEEAIAMACNCRRVFSTASGFFGLGPKTLRSEDLVTILYGIGTPLILRPLNSQAAEYELVGQCYVHGIMDGEAVQMRQSQGKEDEIFNLR